MKLSQIENGLKKADQKIIIGSKNRDRTMVESGLSALENIYWTTTPDQMLRLNGNSISILTAWGYLDVKRSVWKWNSGA